MIYPDLRPVIEAYKRGENITIKLRETLGLSENSPEIIEIAYDLQSGTYIKMVEEDPAGWKNRCNEMASILSALPGLGPRILDVGTGEMTTLTGIAAEAHWTDKELFACDISLSRLLSGNGFVSRHLRNNRVTPFVGNIFRIPFKDNSMDLVWTCHALEPNGGKELAAVRELFRVSRKYVVFFEPAYENNSKEGRARMDRLGYVRGLPGIINQVGGELIECIKINFAAQPLNPTWGYVCKKRDARPSHSLWACPATGRDLLRMEDCFYSPASRLVFPIIKGIPILRVEAGILAGWIFEINNFGPQ